MKLIVIAWEVNTDQVQKTLLERSVIKKTGREIKLLVGKCVVCIRKKSMIVSDNTIQAESFGAFFENLVKKGLNVSKKGKTFCPIQQEP